MSVSPATINLVLQLTLTLLRGVQNGRLTLERIEALIGTAQAEGREITEAELRALAAETDSKFDELEAALKAVATAPD